MSPCCLQTRPPLGRGAAGAVGGHAQLLAMEEHNRAVGVARVVHVKVQTRNIGTAIPILALGIGARGVLGALAHAVPDHRQGVESASVEAVQGAELSPGVAHQETVVQVPGGRGAHGSVMDEGCRLEQEIANLKEQGVQDLAMIYTSVERVAVASAVSREHLLLEHLQHPTQHVRSV